MKLLTPQELAEAEQLLKNIRALPKEKQDLLCVAGTMTNKVEDDSAQ
jgi:hypothetical protein